MPYGTGNWLGLPEMGITEKLGGNARSVNDAVNKSASKTTKPVQYGPNLPNSYYVKKPVYGPPAPSPIPAKTYMTQATNAKQSTGSSGKQSSGSNNYQDDSKAINSIYDDVMSFLNNQKKNIEGSWDSLKRSASAPYDALRPQIENMAEQGVNTLKNYATEAQQEGENALNSARRLYDELNTRNLQQFGSGALGSVGQAASELLSRDQGRTMGGIRTQVGNQVNDINMRIANVYKDRDVKLQELESQKQGSIAQAELRFRDSIAQIDAQKASTQQQKAVAKLEAFRQYRADLQANNNYYNSLFSEINSQANTNANSINNSLKEFTSGVNTGVNQAGANVDAMGNTLDAYGNQIQSNNAVSGNLSLNTDPYANLSGMRRMPEDEYNRSNLYETGNIGIY